MSNLKLHLRFNAIHDANKILDKSGNSNDGTLVGQTTLTTKAPFGSCFYFDGYGDFIDLKPASAIGIKDSSFTAMAWINMNKLSRDNPILGTVTAQQNKGLQLMMRSGKPQLGFYGNDLQSKTILNTDKWYHICYRYDKAKKEQTIFVNGHLDAIRTNAAPFIGDDVVRVGSWKGGHFFAGWMANIRVYDTVLEQDDVQQLMLDDYSGMLLHFRLDEYDLNGKVKDASGNDFEGTLLPENVSPSLIPDDLFGSTLSFDGSSTISIPNNPSFNIIGDMSLSAWVWIERTINDWVRIVGKGETSSSRNYGLWYHAASKLWLFQQRTVGGWSQCQFQANQIELKRWYHLAGVREGNKLTLHLNGVKVLETAVSNAVPVTTNEPIKIGGSAEHSLHIGRISNARLYDRALSTAEIAEVITDDQSAVATFRKMYPLDFDFFDENAQSILYMDEHPGGHEMTLEIENYSKKTIAFEPSGTTASENNHHFELRFRPGTIKKSSQDQIGLTAGSGTLSEVPDHWSIAQSSRNDGTFSIYLLRKPNADPQNKTLLHIKDKIQFTFNKVRADGERGTRSTRIELAYQQLSYNTNGRPTTNAEFITGQRIQHLEIVNHLGQSTSPFHLGVIGSNVILNDTVSSTGTALKLRLTNILKKKEARPERSLVHLIGSDEDSANATKLAVFFDVGSEGWELLTSGQLAGVNVAIADGRWVKKAGTNPWNFELKTGYTLEAKEYIEINLTNVKSSLPSGLSNLYVHYEHVSGYWPQSLATQVKKAPLLYYRDSNKRENVGIGFPNPAAKLAINGGLHIGAISDPGDNNLQVDGALGIGKAPNATYKLDVNGNVNANRYYNGNTSYYLDTDNTSKLNVLEANSIQTNVLYDKQDISFYVNPNGYSRLNSMLLDTGNNSALILKNNSPYGANGFYPTLDIANEAGAGALYITKGWTQKPDGNSWDNPSDLRLKKEVENYTEGLAHVQKIRPVWFRYNGKEGLPSNRQVGIIAQEMREVAPYMVSEFPGGEGTSYLKSNVSALTFMLVNAVKELSAELESCKNQINKLVKDANDSSKK